MPANRKPGMDHDLYEWSPITLRPPLEWPSGASLAVVIIVSAEHFQIRPPENAVQAASLAGGLGARPYPDYARLSHREYGHRVGIFRVLDALSRVNVPPTIAIDAETAERYPVIVERCLADSAEFVAHGIAVTECITGKMSESVEAQYIESTLNRLEHATGMRPIGWFGPEYSESSRTPKLLVQQGITYVCDWVNDEQPYRFAPAVGNLYSLPLMLEYDDAYALVTRGMSLQAYEAMVREGASCLRRDGGESARVLAIHVHPWLIGQPFRIGTFERILEHIVGLPDIWMASGREVIEAFSEASTSV